MASSCAYLRTGHVSTCSVGCNDIECLRPRFWETLTNDIDNSFKGSEDATKYFWILFSQVLIQHHTQVSHQLFLFKQYHHTGHELVSRNNISEFKNCNYNSQVHEYIVSGSSPLGMFSWPLLCEKLGRLPVDGLWPICCWDATALYRRSEASKVWLSCPERLPLCQTHSAWLNPGDTKKIVTVRPLTEHDTPNKACNSG